MRTYSLSRNDMESAGKWLMNGALQPLMRLVVIYCTVSLALTLLFGAITPRDDSDATNGDRSGVEVRRDALTGCEYLESRHGVTPRLRADGHQVCR